MSLYFVCHRLVWCVRPQNHTSTTQTLRKRERPETALYASIHICSLAAQFSWASQPAVHLCQQVLIKRALLGCYQLWCHLPPWLLHAASLETFRLQGRDATAPLKSPALNKSARMGTCLPATTAKEAISTPRPQQNRSLRLLVIYQWSLAVMPGGRLGILLAYFILFRRPIIHNTWTFTIILYNSIILTITTKLRTYLSFCFVALYLCTSAAENRKI